MNCITNLATFFWQCRNSTYPKSGCYPIHQNDQKMCCIYLVVIIRKKELYAQWDSSSHSVKCWFSDAISIVNFQNNWARSFSKGCGCFYSSISRSVWDHKSQTIVCSVHFTNMIVDVRQRRLTVHQSSSFDSRAKSILRGPGVNLPRRHLWRIIITSNILVPTDWLFFANDICLHTFYQIDSLLQNKSYYTHVITYIVWIIDKS